MVKILLLSEAVWRKIHRAIVKGINANKMNIYQLIRKFEMDKKTINNNIKHNLNLKDDFLYLIKQPTGYWKIELKKVK